jgi:hypothetical protein
MQKSKAKRILKYAILFITFIFISGFLLVACNGIPAESEKDGEAEETVIEENQEEFLNLSLILSRNGVKIAKNNNLNYQF